MKGLRLVPWQHKVRHHTTDRFKEDEVVFLKSNPELPLTVYSKTESKVTVSWINEDGIQFHDFPPECILQYEYAGLMVSSDKKFEVSFN